MELFAVAATSNENGSFKPHMPNNDVVCKQFSRGDILGEARCLANVRFISDAEAVDAVATTPAPRAHTAAEKLPIKGIHERLAVSDVQQHQKADYVRLLSEFEDTFSANSDDIGHTCLLYTSPSPRDKRQSRMPSSA